MMAIGAALSLVVSTVATLLWLAFGVGASCEFLAGNAVFEDRSGIRSGGPPVNQIQLLPTGAQRLRMTFTAPDDLQPGRILISLILRFRCGDQSVFNETEPVAFRLRPRSAN
jgi:hypothetical protein